jgi:DNA-binding IclR family transcriptional regulator
MRRRDAVAGEPPRTHLVAMIVGTYREMPGLQLQVDEAVRLFGLRPSTCQVVLDALVDQGELRRTDDGAYVRP